MVQSNTRASYKIDYIIIPFYIVLCYNIYIKKFNIYVPAFLYSHLIYYFRVLPLRYKILLITKLGMRVFISLYVFQIKITVMVTLRYGYQGYLVQAFTVLQRGLCGALCSPCSPCSWSERYKPHKQIRYIQKPDSASLGAIVLNIQLSIELTLVLLLLLQAVL